MWEVPSSRLLTSPSPSRSKCSQLCEGRSLKRATLSSPGEPRYTSVVDTEVRSYRDVHRPPPRVSKAFRLGVKERSQKKRCWVIREVLGILSQTGFLFLTARDKSRLSVEHPTLFFTPTVQSAKDQMLMKKLKVSLGKRTAF